MRRHVAVFDPAAPVADGLGEKTVAERRGRLLHGGPPAEAEVPALGQNERLSAEIRQGNVRRQADACAESVEVDVIRSVNTLGNSLGPAQARLAQHANPGCSSDR